VTRSEGGPRFSGEVRGRVFALYESVSQGGRAVSVALAGALSEVVGLRAMVYAVGALTLACAVLLPSARPCAAWPAAKAR